MALTDRLTRLVPYITACDKKYVARIVFGTETDTLDPEGTVCLKTELPLYGDILACLPSFLGDIMQTPPEYSAVHVGGKRASDRIRNGEEVVLPPRPIAIYTLDILSAISWVGHGLQPPAEDDPGKTAVFNDRIRTMDLGVSCSKGTYIRSLARDIARAAGSSAHLGALRRTAIGPFALENAAGASLLADFGSFADTPVGDSIPRVPSGEIRSSIREFTPDIAVKTGLGTISLEPDALKRFYDGQPISDSWFTGEEGQGHGKNSGKTAVFCSGLFCGIILAENGTKSYEFVYRRDA